MSPCHLISRATLLQSFLSNDLALRLVGSMVSPLRSNTSFLRATLQGMWGTERERERHGPDLTECHLAGNQRVHKKLHRRALSTRVIRAQGKVWALREQWPAQASQVSLHVGVGTETWGGRSWKGWSGSVDVSRTQKTGIQG